MQNVMSSEGIRQLLMTMGALIWVVGVVAIVLGLAIAIVICWFLSSCLERVPAEHRKQQPGMVWLLLIPCFSIVWNFFVYPKIAESYKSYFDAQGRTDVGDCGYAVGLWYSITSCASLIPYLGCVASVAALVLWIMFLVKAATLKNMIPPAV